MGRDDRNIGERTALALRVITDSRTQVFLVRNGLTIGNDRDSDIFVNQPDRWHAIVRDEDGIFIIHTCGDYALNQDTWATRLMELKDGVYFSIGESRFQCFEELVGSDATRELQLAATPTRHACPRCRADITSLADDAEFCPHCGVELPPDCPAWPVLPPEAPPPAPVVHWWTRWMPHWLRSRIDPLFFGRRTTVLAYINTMFNLGMRFEAGTHSRNLTEAGRYYRKAARLGNIPARVRLKVKRF
jgi:hypothetical protein